MAGTASRRCCTAKSACLGPSQTTAAEVATKKHGAGNKSFLRNGHRGCSLPSPLALAAADQQGAQAAKHSTNADGACDQTEDAQDNEGTECKPGVQRVLASVESPKPLRAHDIVLPHCGR